MTLEFMFFMKPWHKNNFINKSGMRIPKNLFKTFFEVFSTVLYQIKRGFLEKGGAGMRVDIV